MKRILLLLIIATIFLCPSHSQVTIGSDEKPNTGALLDLKENGAGSSERGLGLPRVKLSKIDQLFPMFGEVGDVTNDYDTKKATMDLEHLALVVYNVHTDLEEGLCPGLYVWQGDVWVRLPEPCKPPLRLENSPNSYIVSPGSSVEIPCGKPYLVAQERSDLPQINLTDKVSFELLWQDAQNLIDKVELVGDANGPYSKFKVTAKSGTGNALVALRMGANGNSSDPIVWSWHIWVTDYDPNTNSNGNAYPHNNGEKDYVFMDRNLGAVSTSTSGNDTGGLTYQWGRKDPFSGAASFSPEVGPRELYSIDNVALTEWNENASPGGASGTGIKHVLASAADPSATNNLAFSVKSPTTFLYGVYDDASKPVDWHNISDANQTGDNELWGASGAKSAFDPCPEGWRVPAYGTSKSPWVHFEGVDDPWGWGDPTPSPYVKDDLSRHGANFIESAANNVTKLGFYPYINYRRSREILIAGEVGSTAEYAVGGAFSDSNWIDDNGREALLWTANANGANANAKGFSLSRDYSGLSGNEVSPQAVNSSRATGASVRCVKE